MSKDDISDDLVTSTEDHKKSESTTKSPLIPDETEEQLTPPRYEIRLELSERFQVSLVKEIIDQTMRDILSGSKYSSSQAEKLVKKIANTTRERVNTLDMKRYKLIVQVHLGEMRGAGIKCGMRCIWDAESDNFVSDIFQNGSLFCHTTVFGVYSY